MSAKEPEAAAVQLFDATAVSYRAAPSQRTFVALANAMPANDDRARLSEVVFEVALREGFPPLLLAHLAQAMATDDRLQEAQHFCDRWLAVEPDSVEGHRLSVIIACKRLDLDTAQAAYASLQRLEAAEEIQLLTGTLLLLSFTDGQRSAHAAKTMLTEGKVRDPLGPMVAFEASHRCDDGQLLAWALVRDPGLADGDARRTAKSRLLLQRHFLSILARRREPS